MPNDLLIVQLNVSVAQAPLPSSLQQSGAMISQGGTTLAKNTLQAVDTLAALQAILAPALALSGIVWSGGLATATTASPHGYTDGDIIPATVAGASPSGYNYSGPITITGASTFTYPIVSSPGSETTPGTVTLGAVGELLAMGTTYFAGLNQQAPFVLELGEGTAAEGIASLTTWLAANPATIYSFLVPREWNDVSAFHALVNDYTAPNAMTYFFNTGVIGDVSGDPPTQPYSTIKSVFNEVEAPGIPATEFSIASIWATSLALNPNSTNRLTPLSYAPMFGVTPYPLQGNQTTLNNLLQASVNFVNTGYQGGITTPIQWRGILSDGNQFIFWYSADWFQINSNLALSNEVINGSVPGGNPLYYNQDGINRLQNRLGQTARQAVAAGLANGQVLLTQLPTTQFQANYNAGQYEGMIPINAEPFATYTALNPSDYSIGKYAGLSAVYTPILGFLNVFFNVLVTNILTP